MIPSKIPVKLLSEAAGYISVAHVVQRDFSFAELVDLMLPVLGRDAARIRQILRAGTIVIGDYRYRWESLDASGQEVDSVLQTLPGPDPSRVFQPERCFLVRFRRGHDVLDLSREAASRKPLFARQTFWEGLLDLCGSGLRYADYSYAAKADVFSMELGSEGAKLLEPLLPLLKPKRTAEHLERFQPEKIEWLARR